jgi:tubulin polyglutamylase TTLL6/13
VEELGWTV